MNAALNDKAIKALMSAGKNIVEPINDSALQAASIDLKLGNTSYEYSFDKYILGDEIGENLVSKKEFETLPVESGESVFVRIYEKISIPDNTIGIIFPRSSITRLGIQIMPVYMNPGYSGYMPLTIINHLKCQIILKPGRRIAQLVLLSTGDRPETLYNEQKGSKYYGENLDPSKLHDDQDIKKMMDQIIARDAPTLYNMMNKKP